VDNITYSWQLFHDAFEIDKSVREIAKKKFFDGKIPYIEWAQHDISLWKKKKVSREQFFQALKDADVCLMKGAKETLSTLKSHGIKLAIISLQKKQVSR